MKAALLLLVLALTFYLNFGQPTVSTTNIQDIRLNSSETLFENQGRVEVLYNGTWGTICDVSWSTYDGRVACRMLGYSDVVCPTFDSGSGRAADEMPIWMSELYCRGTEQYLDQCLFRGWGPERHTCTSHGDDAGLLCRNDSLLPIPDIRIDKTTTVNIAVIISLPTNWTLSTGMSRFRFFIQYNDTTGIRSGRRYIFPSRNTIQREYKGGINYLSLDTEYSIAVRLEVAFSACTSGYQYRHMPGHYSNPIIVKTNDTVQRSLFGVRLISPIHGLNFLGRVEVNYNNTWGTVCDSFDYSAANVICNLLNYRRAACISYNARMGRGSGTIWLYRLRCKGAEIIDECNYAFWKHSARRCSGSHRDDVGVVCRPDPKDFLPAPQEFNVINHLRTPPTLTWKHYNFPSYLSSKRLMLQYSRSDSPYSYSRTLPFDSTMFTFSTFPTGVTVNITIRPQGRLTDYFCYSYLDGASSERLSFTVMEGFPTGPPQSFHIAMVNCSAIRAEWELPKYTRRNGIVRGYKLMVLHPSGSEIVTDLPGNRTTEYIIGGLEASTRYVVSVLAYTVGDGPRTIYLTATTNPEETCQTDIISLFGIHGNGIDKITLFNYYSENVVDVLCGSYFPGVETDWFYSNGTKVGRGNHNIREVHFANGTTSLQFGMISLCAGGLYTCRANQTSTGKVQQRTLRMKVNRRLPTPWTPARVNVTSTMITVSWSVLPCTGGYDLQYFVLRFGRKNNYYTYFPWVYKYISGIEAHQMNYSIVGLNANTEYQISVRAEGPDYTYSVYSSAVIITTLSPAPSAPSNVAAVLITPDTIQVTWSRPFVPSDTTIVHYTVYATPFISKNSFIPRTKRQAKSLQSVAKDFSSLASTGNVTLPQEGVEYHIQVSVTVFDNISASNRESAFSTLNPNTVIFVPIQGLPIPTAVYISSSSNVSVTVSWEQPTTTAYITGYLMEYSAMVEGRSPMGNLIRFMHEGSSITAGNITNAIVQPLIPQTKYLLKLAALTVNGEGMQVRVTGLTSNASSDFEQFVFFHIRFGPVLDCSRFRKDIEGQQSFVKEQIFRSLNEMCNCGLTDAHIMTGFFSCGQKNHQIIYRAHILGTRNYSAMDLVDLLQSWVMRGSAYITINSLRMQLDPTCPSQLDTLDDPECPINIVTTSFKPKTTESPAKTDKPSQRPIFGDKLRHITASDIGGIIVGVVIAVLLLVVFVIMIGIFIYRWKGIFPTPLRKISGVKKLKEDDVTPFADLDQNTESSMFEEKLK